MAMIGVFSDSEGELDVFDAALKFLGAKGARRFLFAGGRYADLDDWVKWKREMIKAQADYGDSDFLHDVSRYLIGLEQVERPAAFGTAWEIVRGIEESTRVKDRILRAPERGSRAWQDPSVPRKVLELAGDTLCCVVHDKDDLAKDDLLNAPLLVHGNAPEPKVVQIGPRTFVTPGRLTGSRERTVGLLETGDRQLAWSAFTLEGKQVMERQVLQASSRPKVSVK
jgi:hypothetical protein